MEGVTYIILKYCVCLIQAIITMYFIERVLVDKENNNIIIKSCVFSLLLYSLIENLYLQYRGIMYYYIIFGIYVNGFKVRKGFFNIFWVVQFVTDALAIHLIVFVFSAKISSKSFIDFMSNNNKYKLYAILIILLLEVIVGYTHMKGKVIIENFSKKRIAIFSSIFIIIQALFILSVKEVNSNGQITLDKCILLVLLFIIDIFFYQVLTFISKESEEKYLLQMKMKQSELEEKYINEVGIIYNEMKSWKHDYKNNINVICNLAVAGKHEEMNEYIKTIDEEIEITNIIIYTGIFIIDSVITSKARYAMNKGINVNLKIGNIKRLNISDYDFNIILSNLLDNAIEAAINVPEGEISVIIREKYSKIIIHIINDKIGNIEIYNGKYISSKKKHYHGIGLIRVNEIVNKYNGDLVTNFNEDIFECKVILENIKL